MRKRWGRFKIQWRKDFYAFYCKHMGWHFLDDEGRCENCRVVFDHQLQMLAKMKEMKR